MIESERQKNDAVGHLSRRACWAGGQSLATMLMAKSLAQPELVSLAAAFIDGETLPVEPTRSALDVIWSNPQKAKAALQYGTTIGYLPLRRILLERMLQSDGQTSRQTGLSVDQVIITAGSNSALHLLGDTILNPGDIVLCGAPTYFVLLGTLANLGARAVGVDMDEEGMVPESVEQCLDYFEQNSELDRVKAIYVTSYFDNPTGVTLSADRRRRLVEIAKRRSKQTKIRIIEDTAYRELRYWGDDIPSMRSFDKEGDTVAIAGSFSKSFSPGIRVGWIVLPRDLVGPVLTQKGNIDFGSPNFSQHLMCSVLEEGLFDKHLETIRAQYAKKLDAMVEAVEESLDPIGGVRWIRPDGGLYLWLSVPGHLDASHGGRLFDRAVEEGVLYVPGDHCYPAEYRNIPKNTLRLSFGVPPCEEIRCGIAALGRALKQVH
ncbi:MAG: PLP-dependent aminotransferase family protein [Pirellulales bacterium]|nr:PLP-dependent aminotransferase family protein [Pirellulales bacterium]